MCKGQGWQVGKQDSHLYSPIGHVASGIVVHVTLILVVSSSVWVVELSTRLVDISVVVSIWHSSITTVSSPRSGKYSLRNKLESYYNLSSVCGRVCPETTPPFRGRRAPNLDLEREGHDDHHTIG